MHCLGEDNVASSSPQIYNSFGLELSIYQATYTRNEQDRYFKLQTFHNAYRCMLQAFDVCSILKTRRY